MPVWSGAARLAALALFLSLSSSGDADEIDHDEAMIWPEIERLQ